MDEYYIIPKGEEAKFHCFINKYKAIRPVELKDGSYFIDKKFIDNLPKDTKLIIKGKKVALNIEVSKLTVKTINEIEQYSWKDIPELVKIMEGQKE